MSAAIGGSKLLRPISMPVSPGSRSVRRQEGPDKLPGRSGGMPLARRTRSARSGAGPSRNSLALASNPDSVVDQESTRFPSGALGCLLALLGQRRGQRSTLFYLVLPLRSAFLSWATLPGRRWLSGRRQTTDL